MCWYIFGELSQDQTSWQCKWKYSGCYMWTMGDR